MQLTNALNPTEFLALEKLLQKERLNRYLPAAGQDPEIAFQFYVWNCALSEAFYTPLHFAEIGCRNAIHHALVTQVGERWFEIPQFKAQMDPRFVPDLERAVAEEARQHGLNMTNHHIVSAMSFGFWEHLTTKRFARMLWRFGIGGSFPNAPSTATLEDLHDLIESVRRWRNRIAHHRAVFDKGPSRKYADALTLIKWICMDSAACVSVGSSVQRVINERPKPAE